MSPEERIRRRVLRAIALNRTPGFHFPGNFIDLSFDRVARSESTRVSYETGDQNKQRERYRLTRGRWAV